MTSVKAWLAVLVLLQINLLSHYSRILLHISLRHNLLKLVEFLLWSGVDGNSLNSNGKNVLHVAVERNLSLEVIDMVMNYGLDINAKTSEGDTAMHLAAEYLLQGMISKLQHFNADIDAKNMRQWTPLDISITKGDQALIHLLLEYDADIKGPLFTQNLSREPGTQEILAWLADYQKPENRYTTLIKSPDGTSPNERYLIYATQRGTTVIAQYGHSTSFNGSGIIIKSVPDSEEFNFELGPFEKKHGFRPQKIRRRVCCDPYSVDSGSYNDVITGHQRPPRYALWMTVWNVLYIAVITVAPWFRLRNETVRTVRWR